MMALSTCLLILLEDEQRFSDIFDSFSVLHITVVTVASFAFGPEWGEEVKPQIYSLCLFWVTYSSLICRVGGLETGLGIETGFNLFFPGLGFRSLCLGIGLGLIL